MKLYKKIKSACICTLEICGILPRGERACAAGAPFLSRKKGGKESRERPANGSSLQTNFCAARRLRRPR